MIEDKGPKMVLGCVDCNHHQPGWSSRDGYTCEKCGSYVNSIGWWDDIMAEDFIQREILGKKGEGK